MTFAKRMVIRCVIAARAANAEAIKCRARGETQAAEVAREFARMNIAQAKQSKANARQCGEWS